MPLYLPDCRFTMLTPWSWGYSAQCAVAFHMYSFTSSAVIFLWKQSNDSRLIMLLEYISHFAGPQTSSLLQRFYCPSIRKTKFILHWLHYVLDYHGTRWQTRDTLWHCNKTRNCSSVMKVSCTLSVTQEWSCIGSLLVVLLVKVRLLVSGPWFVF